MDKVIVYGLGKMFWDNYDKISARYEVVGYCDKDKMKLENSLNNAVMIDINELKERLSECDYILITSTRYLMDIIMDLTINYGIGREKLVGILYAVFLNSYFGGEFNGITYSGEYEDIYLDLLREKLRIPLKGMKYVEFGVMDPIIASNTYYFYEKGATGILVEANSYLIQNISSIRTRDMVINKAVYAGHENKVNFYISNNVGLSSLNRNHLNGDLWGGHKYYRDN